VLGLQRSAGDQAVMRAMTRPLLARVPVNYAGLFDFDALPDEIFAAVDIVGNRGHDVERHAAGLGDPREPPARSRVLV
jgi:hypothetical protein